MDATGSQLFLIPAPCPVPPVLHSLREPAVAAEPPLLGAAEEQGRARAGQHGHEATSPRCVGCSGQCPRAQGRHAMGVPRCQCALHPFVGS